MNKTFDPEKKLYTLSLLVQDIPGVLSQVARLFSRKGYNIESIVSGETSQPGLTRITIVILGDELMVNQIAAQCRKLIPVQVVKILDEETSIQREFAMIKVRAEDRAARDEVIQMANIFRANIIDVSRETLTVAIFGDKSKNLRPDPPAVRLRHPGDGQDGYPGHRAGPQLHLRRQQAPHRIQLRQKRAVIPVSIHRPAESSAHAVLNCSLTTSYQKECITMAKMYYAKDCDINYLNGKKIAIIGYGSQGHAHALNLKDSGCDVCVGLRAGSKNWSVAEKDGLKVMTVPEAAKWGDIVMMLINDEVQADVYKRDIAPNLEDGNALAFAHGFNIRYQQIVPPKGVDVFMAAPKGPGHTVRSTYVAGKGVPCLVAVEQNATGDAMKIALAYIAGIGGARAGIMETTFHDETETDLFGEQAVLCGGVVDLMKCGFETLVEAGYAPENAYFECIHEMKLIIDLINKGGVAAMNYSISDTAEFGEYVSGPRVLPYEETKKNMKAVLNDIQDGTFAGRWIAENKSFGRTFFNSKRAQLAQHQMEIVGAELRKNMLWGDDTDLDTASN